MLSNYVVYSSFVKYQFRSLRKSFSVLHFLPPFARRTPSLCPSAKFTDRIQPSLQSPDPYGHRSDLAPAIHAILQQENREFDAMFWQYDGHYNAFGNRVFGEAVATAILRTDPADTP